MNKVMEGSERVKHKGGKRRTSKLPGTQTGSATLSESPCQEKRRHKQDTRVMRDAYVRFVRGSKLDMRCAFGGGIFETHLNSLFQFLYWHCFGRHGNRQGSLQ